MFAKTLRIAVLVVCLPIASLANTLTFQNVTKCGPKFKSFCFINLTNGGTTLTLTGSELTSIAGLDEFPGSASGNLGTLSFTTGALSSGSFASGATLSAGGSFVVDTNGTQGLPNGLLFSGSFISPTTWTAFNEGTLLKPDWIYTLTGNVIGTLFDGSGFVGLTTQMSFDVSGHHPFFNKVRLNDGLTQGSIVPEPGTLGLLGTGLLATAALVRRRMLRRS